MFVYHFSSLSHLSCLRCCAYLANRFDKTYCFSHFYICSNNDPLNVKMCFLKAPLKFNTVDISPFFEFLEMYMRNKGCGSNSSLTELNIGNLVQMHVFRN